MSAGDDFLLEEALEQKPMNFAVLRRLFVLTRKYRWLVESCAWPNNSWRTVADMPALTLRVAKECLSW